MSAAPHYRCGRCFDTGTAFTSEGDHDICDCQLNAWKCSPMVSDPMLWRLVNPDGQTVCEGLSESLARKLALAANDHQEVLV